MQRGAHPCLDRAKRLRERLRNRRLRKALVIRELERCALVRRKRIQRFTDAITRRLSGAPADAGEDAALRLIGLGAQILHEVGVGRMIVLSNTEHKFVGVEGYGLSVEGWRGFSKL